MLANPQIFAALAQKDDIMIKPNWPKEYLGPAAQE
jgi:hypothetical protein